MTKKHAQYVNIHACMHAMQVGTDIPIDDAAARSRRPGRPGSTTARCMVASLVFPTRGVRDQMHAWSMLPPPPSGLRASSGSDTVTPFDRVAQCKATTGTGWCRVISRHHDGLSPCPKCLEHAMHGKSGRSRIIIIRYACARPAAVCWIGSLLERDASLCLLGGQLLCR